MRILIADDEPKMGLLLAERLEDDGHFAKSVTSGNDALAELSNGYDLLITDLRMTDIDGIELTRHAKKLYPELPVVLMTAYAGVETAVSAMKTGAEDYIVKPFPLDEMATLVSKIDESHRLRQEVGFRRGTILGDSIIIGRSKAMRDLMEMVAKVARTDTAVLILGDTGTGKELIARAIHEQSTRADSPFIPVNCASLSEELLESELFGHEKGAFTSAHKSKPGRFELADRGTLFMDEIGELSPAIQAKLLRALQDGIISRVGGVNPIKVNIRLICATNRDIEAETTAGSFREDLFYRIAVFPIKLPSLQERIEDVPELCAHFLRRIAYSGTISNAAVEHLQTMQWRGNIRELFNVLERAAILAEGNEIGIDHLPSSRSVEEIAPAVTLDEIESQALIQAIKRSGGNKSKAAKLLGITRRMIYSRMKKLGITENDIVI